MYERYQCQTLFDITQTGVTGKFRPDELPFTAQDGTEITDLSTWNVARNKQRNLETIIQILSLRAQISNITTPRHEDDRWVFEFVLETPDAYGENLQLFVDDARTVPMISIPPGITHIMLEAAGPKQNIWLATHEF